MQCRERLIATLEVGIVGVWWTWKTCVVSSASATIFYLFFQVLSVVVIPSVTVIHALVLHKYIRFESAELFNFSNYKVPILRNMKIKIYK